MFGGDSQNSVPLTYEKRDSPSARGSARQQALQLDGAVGAQWLQAFKGFMEEPVTIML